jgi:hypothetical protein
VPAVTTAHDGTADGVGGRNRSLLLHHRRPMTLYFSFGVRTSLAMVRLAWA